MGDPTYKKEVVTMKIGILTFHASHNYGSMLQAFALQQTLNGWGYENEIINLRTDIQRFLILPPLEWNHLRSSLIKLLKHPSSTLVEQRKYNRFEKFLNEDLKLTPELKNHAAVEKWIKHQNLDTVIVGSDQVWNTGCMDFDTSYLLDFPISIRRIAYAPSLGSFPENLDADKRELLKNAWKDFDYLSTREKRGSDFVHKLTGKKVEVVLDPTLLLDKEHYESLGIGTPLVKEKYLFYYTPREEKGTFHIAKLLAKKLGMKIVVTQSHPDYVGNNIIRINDCGPREFLNVIANADFTIGKSFHLLAFSLIFQKEFLMVSRDKDSRMMNILEPLELEHRLISPDDGKVMIPNPLDFLKIQVRIKELRQSSLQYLHASLGL